MTTADEDAAAKRKKRIKYLKYFAAFIVFQTIIILVFALTVMRIKSPKLRLETVSIENLTTATTASPASPSFAMRMIAQVAIKNTNFGHFKYEDTTLRIFYYGMVVGETVILKGRAKARDTKRFFVTIDVSSSGQLMTSMSTHGNEPGLGVLQLTSQAKVRGKVELMKLIKKNKSADLSCTMVVNFTTKTVQYLQCL